MFTGYSTSSLPVRALNDTMNDVVSTVLDNLYIITHLALGLQTIEWPSEASGICSASPTPGSAFEANC